MVSHSSLPESITFLLSKPSTVLWRSGVASYTQAKKYLKASKQFAKFVAKTAVLIFVLKSFHEYLVIHLSLLRRTEPYVHFLIMDLLRKRLDENVSSFIRKVINYFGLITV